ncbi:MAG: uroporphyrinogen-III synthase [Bacteroidota bacterium]|nr:uroporphyrinogen-III synthase [Bacteroidota bacterium]
MATKGKIETKKSKKREKIIEAASELFSKMNFHEVMMEDVAKLAQIAKGTLYNYYSSKEDLYFSIMVLRMENLINSLREKIKIDATAVDSLHTFVIHNYLFFVKYSCFFRMFQRDSLTAHNEMCTEFKSKKCELRDLLKEIIVSGKNVKLFRDIDTEFASDLILGCIYGAVNRAIDKDYKLGQITDHEREDLLDFILNGVLWPDDSQIDTHFKEEKQLPLKGRTIVITRSVEDSKDSSSAFWDAGADVVSFPTLEVTQPKDWSDFDDAVKSSFDVLIFTSSNAVKMFAKRCQELELSLDYSSLFVIALGKKTSALCQKFSIPVNMVPKEFSSLGLIKELSISDFKGKTVLIPSSAISRDELPLALLDLGAIVKKPVVYSVSIPKEEHLTQAIETLSKAKPDVFIFTSPSTFRNFLDIMKISEPKKYFDSYSVAAIGPTTKSEIEKENVHVAIMPTTEYTMDGLLKEIIVFLS